MRFYDTFLVRFNLKINVYICFYRSINYCTWIFNILSTHVLKKDFFIKGNTKKENVESLISPFFSTKERSTQFKHQKADDRHTGPVLLTFYKQL